MTPAELLQLRRETCEALGWQWIEFNCRECELHGKPPEGALTSKCGGLPVGPHYESDNGLALDVLVKFCDEHKLWFTMDSNLAGFVLRLDSRDTYGYLQDAVQGETPAICICRALVASAKKGELK